MYQINFLPWRQALYRHQAQRWLYWSMILVVITFSACGYYAYYLVQQVKTLSLLQSQYQKREYSLQKQYHNDQHEQKVTRLYQQRYWHYYQHWLHYLNYLAFFQALETLLPTEGYIAQFSENDATFSLQVRLPCEQALTFISKVNQHSNLTSLTLSSFQQSKQDPRYSEIRFSGKWQSWQYQVSQHRHSEQDVDNNENKD